MALHLHDESLLSTNKPFATLLSRPGVSEILTLRSQFGLMAFHGGWLEEVTDDIASEVALRANASVYAVLQGPNDQWHLPSHLVCPDESPSLAAFLDHVDVAISIHGFGRPDLMRSVLLGGQNRQLAEHVAINLIEHLPHYEVLHKPGDVPLRFAGQHPMNPVNLPRMGGVQIELPPRIRGKSPMWTGFNGREVGQERVPHHEALIAGLVQAVETWPL